MLIKLFESEKKTHDNVVASYKIEQADISRERDEAVKFTKYAKELNEEMLRIYTKANNIMKDQIKMAYHETVELTA